MDCAARSKGHGSWAATGLPGALLGLLALLVLAGCAPLSPKNPLASWAPSDNYGPRRPQLIVLHFTDEPSVEEALETLQTRNDGGPVSAHYLIGRDGHVFQLVRDFDRAWHAGGGHWGTISDVNSASIGIEIDNDGESPFPQVQIASLLVLLEDLVERHGIPRTAIIGHEDMAPTRKVDPGPLFPWQELAAHGFGLWPCPERVEPSPGFDPWLALVALGYSIDVRDAAMRAFHHHYRGSDGLVGLDSEDRRILYDLSRQLVTVRGNSDNPTRCAGRR